MIVFALVFAVLFGLAAGIFGVVALRDPSRSAIFLWVACAVSLMQAFALASVAAFSDLGTPGYVAALVVAGVVLIAVLCWAAYKTGPRRK